MKTYIGFNLSLLDNWRLKLLEDDNALYTLMVFWFIREESEKRERGDKERVIISSKLLSFTLSSLILLFQANDKNLTHPTKPTSEVKKCPSLIKLLRSSYLLTMWD